jgi:DNA-directed RNA polymerase subunit beta
MVNVSFDDGVLERTLKKDPGENTEDALRKIHKRLHLGEPVLVKNADLISRLFLERKRSDLGRIGRKKLTQRLRLDEDINDHLIDTVDIVAATKFVCRLRNWEEYVDDIDHLRNRLMRNLRE